MRGYKATLSDGTSFTEEDKAWLDLKKHLQSNNLKIVDFMLLYDHHQIFCRKNAPVYFYMKKIEAWVQNEFPKRLFYGIGAMEQPGFVTITWFDGNDGYEEKRKINNEDLGIWTN